MSERVGEDGKPQEGQEPHRMLDRILESDYADVVHAILKILYQRMLEPRHDDLPDSPDHPR